MFEDVSLEESRYLLEHLFGLVISKVSTVILGRLQVYVIKLSCRY